MATDSPIPLRPQLQQRNTYESSVAADFTNKATRTGELLPEPDVADELDDVSHPLFDALQRDTVAHTQQRIRTP